MNLPRTAEGFEAWDVVERCAGQVRTGMAGAIGLDFVAAFQVGDALGYGRAAIAEFLPVAEAGMLDGFAKLNREGGSDGKS